MSTRALVSFIFLGLLTAAAAAAQPATAPAPGQPLPNLPPLPSVGDEALNNVLTGVAPLTPDQIRQLRKVLDEAERAAAQPPGFVPKPVSSQVVVSLKPGETPPVVRLGANYVTNILFVDQGGEPLMITDVDTSAAKLFTTTWSSNKESLTNVVKLSPNSTYAMGNISATLKGVPAPVSLTLISGQREVDYRVDVRVQGVGTTAASSTSKMPPATSGVMRSLLEGVAPEQAKPLISSDSEVQAWAIGDHFYIRTGYTLLSPAHLAVERSADGTAVYELLPTPVVIALFKGAATQINLTGY